jgi:hypothetical protein
MILAIIIIFIFFIIVFINNTFINDSSKTLRETFAERNECVKLAYLITEVYSEGDGAQTQISLDMNAQVFAPQRTVKVGEQFCGFLANLKSSLDGNAFVGDVVLENEDGNINIS